MDFWIVAAILTFVAMLVVMLPLTRREKVSDIQGAEDRAVYIQQLKEVDTDLARGLLDAEAAEQARLEIARRILKADKQISKQSDTGQYDAKLAPTYALSGGQRLLVAMTLLFIPLASWGLYGFTGSPDLPSQPLGERQAIVAPDAGIAQLLAQAEAHLAQNPADGRGWALLAPIYLRSGRVDDAINAYRKALDLVGTDTERLIGLAEALMLQAGGNVTPEALALFEQAGKLDPNDLRPVLMQVRVLMQSGQKDAAIAVLQGVLDTAPDNVAWRKDIEQTIISLKRAEVTQTHSGPSAEDIEAASQLDAQGRKDMIRGMVDGLAQKLKDNPVDATGWERLVRAYIVLGETDNARAALQTAAKALPEADMRQLQEIAVQAGLENEGALQ